MGRYGDTRVDPVPLFDVHDPGPPPDAIDIQFRAPLTVSLLLDRLLERHTEQALAFLTGTYREVVTKTVTRLQFVGGYVADGSFSWPARLELATDAHLFNNDELHVRVHHHLWLGRTAVGLHDGTRRPVDLDGICSALAHVVWADYLNTLEDATTRDLGVTWRSPRPGAGAEITAPPLHVGLTGREDLGICTQPWGPRETWGQPTPAKLAFQAEQERYAARNVALGRSEWVPPDQPRRPTYWDEPDSW